jgi:hypothetical protein
MMGWALICNKKSKASPLAARLCLGRVEGCPDGPVRCHCRIQAGTFIGCTAGSSPYSPLTCFLGVNLNACWNQYRWNGTLFFKPFIGMIAKTKGDQAYCSFLLITFL